MLLDYLTCFLSWHRFSPVPGSFRGPVQGRGPVQDPGHGQSLGIPQRAPHPAPHLPQKGCRNPVPILSWGPFHRDLFHQISAYGTSFLLKWTASPTAVSASSSGRYVKVTALDPEHPSHNQGLGHSCPCLGEDPPECRPRDVHHACGRLLVHPLEVYQPNCLKALNWKNRLASSPGRHAVGNKGVHHGMSLNKSEFSRPWHFLLRFERAFII